MIQTLKETEVPTLRASPIDHFPVYGRSAQYMITTVFPSIWSPPFFGQMITSLILQALLSERQVFRPQSPIYVRKQTECLRKHSGYPGDVWDKEDSTNKLPGCQFAWKSRSRDPFLKIGRLWNPRTGHDEAYRYVPIKHTICVSP